MSDLALKPGVPQLSETKAIERYFNVALFLLVLSGFVMLGSTGSLDLLAITGVGLALLVRAYFLLARREFQIRESWTTYLTLLYIVIYFADYFFLSGSFLTATIHLVLFLIVMRLFTLQRARDHYLLAVLSFLMVLASAVLTVGSTFVFAFAGFLFIAIVTLVLMEMRHSSPARPAGGAAAQICIWPRTRAPTRLPPHGIQSGRNCPGSHATDPGRRVPHLLLSAAHLLALPDRLLPYQRRLHRLF